MALISLLEASLRFGDEALLDKADFTVEEGEKICLLGRNGTGKSTLLKVLSGQIELDAGRLIVRQGLRIARLEQDPPLNAKGTALSMALSRIPVVGPSLERFYLTDSDEERSELSVFIEAHDGWVYDSKVRKLLNEMNIDPEVRLEALSGGWRRKAALARALAQEPELLLLDEPTNHLDLKTILSLENFIQDFKGTLIFVSHDRAFADDCAHKIVELDRGKLYPYEGNFAYYLKMRDERLRMETLERKEFDRVLSEEEAWIRRGVKARLARNEGRVRNLEELRRIRRERRDRQGRAIMQITEADRSGNIVYELREASLSFDGQEVIKPFSATIMRGDRIGLMGPNGAGKTSLVKMLLGKLKATHGYIREGANLQIQYFDQYHEQLDLNKSVADNVAEGRRDVIINGKTTHVNSYLKDFLFTVRRARSPASVLSGGEKNRLMLARLFAKPCNVLILDEPTNDLDLETLELLEELVAGFSGTVIVISHDRRFIDRVATETWIFDGQGGIETVVGGYSDVLAYYQRVGRNPDGSVKAATVKAEVSAAPKKNPKKKGISFTQEYELAHLPEKVEAKERELAEYDALTSDPAFYQQDGEKVKSVLKEREDLVSEIEALYVRWEELEALAAIKD